MNKRCTNCDRFPFCEIQKLCIWNKDNRDLTQTYLDYWIKRENKGVVICQN